jgi:hypothetical protein
LEFDCKHGARMTEAASGQKLAFNERRYWICRSP